ncbi:MAG TPA: hypothetical protein VFF48_11685 [Brevundimonas sp.]|nr:hypothetical protein [Brevundimonas sp.]
MLVKLEALYLNILRVVILVLATLLLVGAAIGAVIAAPMLMSSFGGGESNAARMVQNDRLADYLGGGRQEPAQAGAPTAEQEEAARQSDRRIREAAQNLSRYVQAKQGFNPVTAAITGYIQEQADSLPPSLFEKYCDSILALSRDLVARPAAAAPVNVDELIPWHHQRFMDAAQQAAERDAVRAMEEAARRGAAVAAGAAAAGLFMMFLLLVFVFVLVKIERNLRLLPVLVSDEPETPSSPIFPAATSPRQDEGHRPIGQLTP